MHTGKETANLRVVQPKLELRLRNDPSLGMKTSPYLRCPVKLPDLEIPPVKKGKQFLELTKTPSVHDDGIKALIKKYPPVVNKEEKQEHINNLKKAQNIVSKINRALKYDSAG